MPEETKPTIQPVSTPVADIDPSEDGVSHINVYSRGATSLGRALSNISECNIEHPFYGHFRSLEGLWFFMRTGHKYDDFRIMKGMNARNRGKELENVHFPMFNKMFKLGMLEKLDRNPILQKQLVENELPLMHYYVYGKKVIPQMHHQWQMDYWMLLRSSLKNTGSLSMIRDELMESIKYHMSDSASPKSE
ncbi:hypothetical protein D3C85_13780 [compost metagenome]